MSRIFHLLTVAFSVLAIPTIHAQEDIRSEVLGFWQARVRFISDDAKATAKSQLKIERLADTGLKITRNLRYLGGPDKEFENQTISYLYPSGRSRSTECMDYQPVAFGRGKWSSAGSTLSITEKWVTDSTSYRMTSRHSLRDPTRMRLNGTLSGGISWSGPVGKELNLD